MKVLLIMGHQQPGSFCHGIARTAIDALCRAGHEVICHDLYQERFDPLLPHAEIPKGIRWTPRSASIATS